MFGPADGAEDGGVVVELGGDDFEAVAIGGEDVALGGLGDFLKVELGHGGDEAAADDNDIGGEKKDGGGDAFAEGAGGFPDDVFDGFVAFLNGERIAARNAPERLDGSSVARRKTSTYLAVRWFPFAITPSREHFRAGRNILALQLLNVKAADTDAMLHAELSLQDVESIRPAAGAVRYDQSVSMKGISRLRAAVFDGRRWSPTVTVGQE